VLDALGGKETTPGDEDHQPEPAPSTTGATPFTQAACAEATADQVSPGPNGAASSNPPSTPATEPASPVAAGGDTPADAVESNSKLDRVLQEMASQQQLQQLQQQLQQQHQQLQVHFGNTQVPLAIGAPFAQGDERKYRV